MRINELHLAAYGPFADRKLDFTRGTHGLHVIFGPNEAGKSSALRALKALLYGVDERTTDAFLHDPDKLRIGGRLRLSDGRELSFVRRKGRKNTILSPADNSAIDDVLLAPFLSGISASVFSTMFGIDHPALVAGGEEILRQEGDVGTTLFAAALGNDRLQATLAALEQEADELYRPHGSKYAINLALAAFKAARQEVKASALAVSFWKEHQQSLTDATNRLAEISELMSRFRRERRTVERLLRILPQIALRQQHLATITSLGPVVELAPDFAERRLNYLSDRKNTEETAADLRHKLVALREEAAQLAPPGRLLEEGSRVSELVELLGSYRKSLRDRPANEGKRQQARNDARDTLRSVRPDLVLVDVPPLRPGILLAKPPIAALVARHQAVVGEERKATSALANKEREIEALQGALAAFPTTIEAGPLKRKIAEARKPGDLDDLLRDGMSREKIIDRKCREQLESIGLLDGPVDAALSLPVPGNESINRYADLYRITNDRQRSLAEQRQRIEDQLAVAQRELDGIVLAGAVPTELDLQGARERREAGWTLIKRAWLDKADVTDEARAYDGTRDLSLAYEVTKAAADDIGDRLRREADRVANHAAAVARRIQCEGELAEVESQETKDAVEKLVIQREWTDSWLPSGIQPLSPDEMRDWLSRFSKLKSLVTDLSDRRDQNQSLRETITKHQRQLAALLVEAGEDPPEEGGTLGPFLEKADGIVERIEALSAKRRDLHRLTMDRTTLEGDLARASANLAEWKLSWGDEMKSLGQPDDARPASIGSLLESYDRLFAKLDEEDDLKKRIFGIDQEIMKFEQAVRALVDEVAPELWEGDSARCVERLKAALARASTNKTHGDAISKQLHDLMRAIEAADERLAGITVGITSLCTEAQCERTEDLGVAEQRAENLRSLRRSVEELDKAIVLAGDGASLSALLSEAAETVADDLPARLESVKGQITALEGEQELLQVRKGAEENEMRRMTGESTAGDAAARAQEHLATIRRHLETYLRTRVATLVLKKEVARYRDANQHPLLARGGELFAALSCGSFSAIGSEIVDDEPRLVGIRPDGLSVAVGGMSSGTLDQLFLALRFATLERHLESSEPMPFVVDDILINFDDERAQATLEFLAGLSAKTQVMLFTHHTRIRDMAGALHGPNGVFLQELP
jgi:uncharacterized protein YhaN